MKSLHLLRYPACCLFILLCVQPVSAQYDYINTNLCFWDVQRTGIERRAEPSPEAMAMRRYQDYPVSHATGTVDISIPLVELPAGGATVSLGMMYHTGAVKCDEHPTDIGLGWTMTGLGIVSRQINGYPDEWTGDNGIGGFYEPRRISFRLDPYSQDWRYMLGIMEGWYDTDYDLFSYSVPGYSGHFIIQNDTTRYGASMSVNYRVRQLPPTDLNIQCYKRVKDGLLRHEFYITTPEGIRYQFNQADIVSRTTMTTPSAPLSYADTDYEAESAWHPTFITDNKSHGDTIRITYRNGESWTRGGNYTCTSQGYMIYPDQYDYTYRTKYSCHDNCVRMENTVSSHTRMIPATISGASGTIILGGGNKTSTITLRNANGDVIKTVRLDNGCNHADGRRRLDGVTVECDGVVTEKYSFTYNPSMTAPGSDLFGYSNGSGYRHRSVLGLALEWEGRRPDPASVSTSSLKSITDIAGITTTLEYEPAEYRFGADVSIFGSSVCIGHRIRSIKAECAQTGRTRIHRFIYDKARCNINLSALSYIDFLTQSGVYEKVSSDGSFRYSFGVTHTTSPTTRGVPLENAVVYYGHVTEYVSGTGIEHPVRTVYEYDTDPMINTFHQSYRTGTCSNNNAIRKDKFLPLYSCYYSNDMQGFDPRPLRFAFSNGYFQERTGAAPLLKCRTDYVWINGEYIPCRQQRSIYSEIDKEEIYVGGHCESTVLVKLNEYENDTYGIDCINDMNYYFIKLYSSRFIKESDVTTIYYPDGNSRSVKTEYLNRGSQVRHTPGFEFDTTRVTPSTISHRPMGVHISCGDESLTSLTLSSWMSTDMRLRDAAYDRFTRTKPEVEKLVFRTAEGADSVHRRYGYRYGINFRIFLDRISLEAGTYIDGDTAVISRRLYTDYDRHYRPLSIVDEQGRGIDLTWMELYDHMTSMTYRDADLATSYTYKPFTGCTGITYPSGQTRRYGYKAGRLTRISNTRGETLQEYSYRLYNDGTGETGRNSITQKVYSTSLRKPQPGSGPMRTSVMIWPTDTTTVNEDIEGRDLDDDKSDDEVCEDCDIVTSAGKTVYYDGFGMPVQTVNTVAGGSLIRSAVDYDAVDRPTRQYLPTAAYDENYMEEISDQSVSYYGDSYPFTQVKYREMSGDQPLQVLKEGKAMQEHPLLYEYLCNNVTDTQLRCRRYRLSGGRDSETVTLDGYYPAGALDVTRQTDPDGCTLLTFTDWRGLRILDRRPVDNDTYADTYYLYDVMGNVRVILQPEAVVRMTRDSSTWTDRDEVLDKFAFINRYDRRGNCIYAKVPGAGAVRMRYDRYNRLAYRQTAVMRERGEAEFILYDPIGRVAVCGITADGLPQTIPVMTARYDGGNIAGSIDSTGYTVTADLDLSEATVTRVNYYDSYDCLQQKGFASLPAENFTPDPDTAKGMFVAARTAYYRHSDSGYDVSGTDESLYSVYCYDKEGRVTTEVSSTIIEGIYHTVTHGYSRQGHETECTEHINVTEPQCLLKRTTEYDALGNILRMGSGSSLNPGTVRSPEYIYDELGRLSQVRAGITVGYRYDMRGRLTGISHPAFSQTIEYESGRSPRYNGNISEITTSRNDEYPDIRIFGYDRLNRLTSMSSVYRFSTQYSYDLNSGPLTIRRSGLLSDGTVGVVDDLSLTYDGNRLIKVTDDADPVLLERSCDFYGQESVYGYNADGALYSDTSRGIEAIEYAPTGQPVAIRDADGILIARYAYSADGRRLSSGYSTVPGQEPTGNRHFIGSFEVFKYDRDIMNRTMLERIRIPWGEILYDNTALLHMRDYQGNVCAVIEPVSGGVAQTTEYYPYGLPTASSTGQVQNTYKFSGKTFEAYRGMNRYDFHARQYDPALGLFDRPDPMAAEYPWLNPYLYCAANPVMHIDPTGLDTWRINAKGEVVEWIDTKEFDCLEFIDDKGNIRVNSDGEEQRLQFKYGTVLNYRKEKYANLKSINYGKQSGEADIFEIKGDKAGTAAFEMFAQNVTGITNNEVALIRTGAIGKNERNFITSGHRPNTETGTAPLFNGQLCNGYYIREHIHSHSTEYYPSMGDITAKFDIQDYLFKRYGYCANFYIYHTPTKKYIKY